MSTSRQNVVKAAGITKRVMWHTLRTPRRRGKHVEYVEAEVVRIGQGKQGAR